MKIRTSLHAGGKGCSPETQNYMQKALNMQNKVYNCTKNAQPVYGYYPPYYGNVPSTTTTTPSYVGTTYPDMSGVCG